MCAPARSDSPRAVVATRSTSPRTITADAILVVIAAAVWDQSVYASSGVDVVGGGVRRLTGAGLGLGFGFGFGFG
jgi:hypothetical protein